MPRRHPLRGSEIPWRGSVTFTPGSRKKGSSVNVPITRQAHAGQSSQRGIFRWPQMGAFGWPPGVFETLYPVRPALTLGGVGHSTSH